MRLHRIEIENLNSLHGEQVIDFEGTLGQAPLFLIMGPTGAGKTTILDAICLALFGSTPRARDESGKSMKASLPGERLMSHDTGECRAAIVFSLLDEQGRRQRYRAIWRCQRAHKRPTGNIQDPERSLEQFLDDGEVKILASSSRKKDYEPAFDKVLQGLTEESFLRSVMLAQGQFSAFLHASEDQKAAILERLTETDQYRRIGHRAQLVFGAKKKVYDDVVKLLAELPGVDGATLVALEEELQGLNAEAIVLGAARRTATERYAWLKTFIGLEEEIAKLAEDLAAATGECEAHQEDFARLELGKKARPVEKYLRDVERLEGEQDKLAATMPDLREAVASADHGLKSREEALMLAARELGTAKAAMDARLPAILEARELRRQHRESTKRYEALEGARKSAAREREGHLKALDEATRGREQAREVRDASAARFAEVEGYAGLVESLSGLFAGYESLEKTRRAVDDGRRKRRGWQDELGALAVQETQLEEAIETSRQALLPLEEAVDKARAALAQILGEATEVVARRKTLREERDGVEARRQAARKAGEWLGKLKGAKGELESIQADHEKVAKDLEGLDKELLGLEELVETCAMARQTAQESLDIVKQSLALSTHRAMLNEGDSCPLCGSEEHPLLAEGSHHEADARLRERAAGLEDRLAEAQTAHENARTRQGALKTRRALAQQKMTDLEGTAAAAEASRAAFEAALGEALEKAELSEAELSEAEFSEAAIETVLVALAERLEELALQEERLDETHGAFVKAEGVLRDAREAFADVERRREVLQAKQTQTVARIGELDDVIGNLEVEEKAELAELVAALEGLGIDVGVGNEGPDVVGGLEQARKLREAYVEARDAARHGATALEKAEAEVVARSARAKDAEERFVEAEKAQQSEGDELEALAEKVAQSLDGEDPDVVEGGLRKEVDDAATALEAAQGARAAASEAAKLAAQKHDDAKERLGALEEALRVAREVLEAKVGEVGFANIAEVCDALLPEEVFATLEEKVDALKQALNTATDRLAGAKARDEAHRKGRPEGLDEASLEELDGVRQEAEAAYVELQQRLGQLTERLEHGRGELARRRELEEKRERLGRDLEVWRELRNLIGTNNGAAFQKYAQALNLRELVQRANRHLDTLTDRYRLKVAGEDTPRLDFEILDRDHAGQARPLSTLSGGEVFLVSLAMALALSDSGSRSLKMETLLLDEGFGTLDPESLSTALSLLNNLHLDGNRQVGLISHVEGLKERIPYRVEVSKLGGGRSKIEVKTT